MGCELWWVRPRHGPPPWVKNDSADTVWGYYRHSAGDAGDAAERSWGSKPPKVSRKRLRTDMDLPGTCSHFLLCSFHEQGQGDERGLLLRPTDGKPPVNLLASGFLHKRSRKISEVNCDHNSLSLWQHNAESSNTEQHLGTCCLLRESAGCVNCAMSSSGNVSVSFLVLHSISKDMWGQYHHCIW